MKIIHRAGRVHSNVDPISRLRRRVPESVGPNIDDIASVSLLGKDIDPMKNMFDEISDNFERKLLNVSSGYVRQMEEDYESCLNTEVNNIDIPISEVRSVQTQYVTASTYTTLIHLPEDEVEKWKAAYLDDPTFSKVIENKQDEKDIRIPQDPQYHYADNGMLYFEDWRGNNRLCVPKSLRLEVISEIHDTISEASHAGYHKTYNRTAATHFWPRMSRDIKEYVNTCDICQKAKPKRHAPIGLLQPIPIPSQPFEVVSMDFIPELPISGGYDNILVIVDS